MGPSEARRAGGTNGPSRCSPPSWPSTEAYHDFAQSATVFDLLGERYQAALSHLALGRLAARAGSRPAAERYLKQAANVFGTLGAQRDLDEAERATELLSQPSTGVYVS